MVKCAICGKTCPGTTIIYDKRFAILPDMGAKVCKLCFDDWASGNQEAIEKKIKNKILGNPMDEAMLKLKEAQENNETDL